MDHSNQAQLGFFRNAAAGLIKSAIRARARQAPKFLSAKDYKRWGVTELESESRSCAQLLTHVRQLREQFEARFFENQFSISEPDSATDNSENLAERVAGFICGDLDDAICVAAKGKTVAWDRLANWNELASLRDALDRLPLAIPLSAAGIRPVALSRKVILYDFKDKPVVNGKEKPVLKPNHYKLVRALIEAGGEGLKKSRLDGINSDYWKALKALKESDRDWDQVIHFPGPGNHGYWID
jgi:hypothetical protein